MVSVTDLEAAGVLLVQDGNHGEYRPRPHEFEGQGAAYIRAVDMSDGAVNFDAAGRINAVARRRVRKGIGEPGDVLFSHKGTVGKLARVPFDAPDFVCSPQTTFWRTLDETQLRVEYLYCFMRSQLFIAQWWVRKGETDMADYVSLTAQRQLRVQVPPIDVQKRIADPIIALDDLIANIRRRVDVLEEMGRAIYREWFVHLRFPGHDDASLRFTESGAVPEGWGVRPLGDLTTNLDRYRKPLAKAERANHPGPFPYYGAAKLIDRVDGWLFEGEHLLFAEDGSVQTTEGYPVLQLVDERFWANNHTHVLRGNGVSTRFLYFACGATQITGYVTGAAQPKITQSNLNRLPILVGTPDVQSSFDAVVNPLLDERRKLQRSVEPLEKIRDMLLPKLVTGHIDVSGLDLDAVAEQAGV